MTDWRTIGLITWATAAVAPALLVITKRINKHNVPPWVFARIMAYAYVAPIYALIACSGWDQVIALYLIVYLVHSSSYGCGVTSERIQIRRELESRIAELKNVVPEPERTDK